MFEQTRAIVYEGPEQTNKRHDETLNTAHLYKCVHFNNVIVFLYGFFLLCPSMTAGKTVCKNRHGFVGPSCLHFVIIDCVFFTFAAF